VEGGQLPALKYHYSHRRFTYGVIGDWHATSSLLEDNATVRCLSSGRYFFRWRVALSQSKSAGACLSCDPLVALAPTVTSSTSLLSLLRDEIGGAGLDLVGWYAVLPGIFNSWDIA